MALQGFNKPHLNFSIASILRKQGGTPLVKSDTSASVLPKTPCSPHRPRKTSAEQPRSVYKHNLPWLNYSRFHPPKIPRTRLKRNYRRKTSGKPRVPFSTAQLILLENKYNQTRYLSSSELSGLSASLSLPEHRVKVWFQNRRAKEKRTRNSDLQEREPAYSGLPHQFAAIWSQHHNINTSMWPMALSQRLRRFSCTSDHCSAASLRLIGPPCDIFRSPVDSSARFARFHVPSSVWPRNFGCVRECLQSVQSCI